MIMKMKHAAIAALILGSAAGCMQKPDPVISATMLTSAEAVIGVITEANISSVNVEGVSKCIVTNSTPKQLAKIAAAAETGIDQNVIETVLETSIKSETVTCIEGLGLIRL